MFAGNCCRPAGKFCRAPPRPAFLGKVAGACSLLSPWCKATLSVGANRSMGWQYVPTGDRVSPAGDVYHLSLITYRYRHGACHGNSRRSLAHGCERVPNAN